MAHAAGARGARAPRARPRRASRTRRAARSTTCPTRRGRTPRRPPLPACWPAFDSVLLAYASKRRKRILPDAHRDAVYERRNLQIRPSYLVDGLVAGTWSTEVKRREATLTLRPLERLARATRTALVDEAERLVRDLQPQAKAHKVVVAR